MESTTGAGIFVGAYFFFTTVVLMNLLIAMMSSTYENIRQTADLQYKTLKVGTVIGMRTDCTHFLTRCPPRHYLFSRR
jgi:hypothetical protein